MKWNYDPVATTCEECSESNKLEGEEPPCDTCDRPQELFPGNEKILEIWDRCNALREVSYGMGGVVPMKLKMSEIKVTCEIFGVTVEDLQGVLAVEQIAYPFVAAQYKPKE